MHLLNLNFDSKMQFLFFQKSDALGIEESHNKCFMVLIDVFSCLRSVFCNLIKNSYGYHGNASPKVHPIPRIHEAIMRGCYMVTYTTVTLP